MVRSWSRDSNDYILVRSAALSFACSMARLGSMLAPFIALLSTVHPVLPIFVFGSINFVMGVQVSCGWWTRVT